MTIAAVDSVGKILLLGEAGRVSEGRRQRVVQVSGEAHRAPAPRERAPLDVRVALHELLQVQIYQRCRSLLVLASKKFIRTRIQRHQIIVGASKDLSDKLKTSRPNAQARTLMSNWRYLRDMSLDTSVSMISTGTSLMQSKPGHVMLWASPSAILPDKYLDWKNKYQ